MKKQRMSLSAADRTYLQGLLCKGSLNVKAFKRATALLELERGRSFSAVAATLGVCLQSVSAWCKAYREEGLKMLWDKPRSGRAVEIDGKQRAKITALACSEAPEGYARWSLRLLADRVVELWATANTSRTTTPERF